MFTGIIEKLGKVEQVMEDGENRIFWLSSPLATELHPDQSLSHNGVCLTVEEVTPPRYRVTAVGETLKKTNLGAWGKDTLVNLERCMQLNGRIDGHLVQGHVDTTAVCISIHAAGGSYELTFALDNSFANHIIEKGSVTINGISLTAFTINENEFSVAIVPYTWAHTNINSLKVGQLVNIEFDMIGKYVKQYLKTVFPL